MLPKYGFDWPPVPDTIEVPLRKGALRQDYALAGKAIGTAITEPRSTLWTFLMRNGQIVGTPKGSITSIVIYTNAKINEFGICFDRENYPVIAYTETDGKSYLRYPIPNGNFTTIPLPDGAYSPRCVFDLKAGALSGVGEVVVGYMLGKDLYVLQSSKDFKNPRLAASYLQDLYLDQISFAANSRLRFIMYQLHNPDSLPDAEAIPQSKYSCFLYRRTFSGSVPPIDSNLVTFSSVGLKYQLKIEDNDLDSPDVRGVGLRLALRPEWVEPLRSSADYSKPIIEMTKTTTKGHGGSKQYSLQELDAIVGSFYDPDLQLYTFPMDYFTEGPNERIVVIKYRDLVVGETTYLVINESIAGTSLNERAIWGKFPDKMVNDFKQNGIYPLTGYSLAARAMGDLNYKVTEVDPRSWVGDEPVFVGNLQPAYIPEGMGISKRWFDSVSDTTVVLSYTPDRNRPQESVGMTKAQLKPSIGQPGGVYLDKGYYWLMISSGWSKPEKSVGKGYIISTPALPDSDAVYFNVSHEVDLSLSETKLTFVRPSKTNPSANVLRPEANVVERLSDVEYSYQFKSTANSGTQREMSVDIYLPKSFFFSQALTANPNTPDMFKVTNVEILGTQTIKNELVTTPDGFPISFPHRVEGAYIVCRMRVQEPAVNTNKTHRQTFTFTRKLDNKVLKADVLYTESTS